MIQFWTTKTTQKMITFLCDNYADVVGVVCRSRIRDCQTPSSAEKFYQSTPERDSRLSVFFNNKQSKLYEHKLTITNICKSIARRILAMAIATRTNKSAAAVAITPREAVLRPFHLASEQ